MDIIPAIDLKNGKVVRLKQGLDTATTYYSDDPVATAEEWIRQGANRLHIVNLDGAFGRESGNLEVLRAISRRRQVAIQYGGGLRSREAVQEAVVAGAEKIVLGTSAVEDPGLLREVIRDYGQDRCIVALDAMKGKVALRGWTHLSELRVKELAERLQKEGVREILYTDISRDGMMTGPDRQTLIELCELGLRVIASGGVATHEDVRDLAMVQQPNLVGVIIGRALYEGAIDLPRLLTEIAELTAGGD